MNDKINDRMIHLLITRQDKPKTNIASNRTTTQPRCSDLEQF
jgi:hypothetical protein